MDMALEHDRATPFTTEETRTAKPAVRATCFLPEDPNLTAQSRDGKDADRRTRGPRYPLHYKPKRRGPQVRRSALPATPYAPNLCSSQARTENQAGSDATAHDQASHLRKFLRRYARRLLGSPSHILISSIQPKV